MTDEKIVGLFFRRSQQAVAEVRSKYGKRLDHLAQNLLGNTLDAEECVNDTLLTAWNSIPPQRPESLSAWLTATLRNHCMNRLRSNLALKRGGGAVQGQLEELDEVLTGADSTEAMADARELGRLLNAFVGRLPRTDRTLLLGRYLYGESYYSLSHKLGLSESACEMRISRLRKKLRAFLKKEGVL